MKFFKHTPIRIKLQMFETLSEQKKKKKEKKMHTLKLKTIKTKKITNRLELNHCLNYFVPQ